MLRFVFCHCFFYRYQFINLFGVLYIRLSELLKTKTKASLLLKSIVLQDNSRTFNVLYLYLRYKFKYINSFRVLLYAMDIDNRNDYIHVCIRMYENKTYIHVSRNTFIDQLSSTLISRTFGYLELFTQSRQVQDTEV